MAKGLNKNRIRDSWLVAVVSLALMVTTRSLFGPQEAMHEVLELVGYMLVTLCALGRIYTSAFLGGFKNASVINYGPFSVVRNPLYVFSLMGITGIALMSLHLPVMLFAPVAMFCIYFFLVRREEGYLAEHFGSDYAAYCEKTPRFIPNFSGYAVPEVIPVSPKHIQRAIKDAIWWFMAFPLFEIFDLF